TSNESGARYQWFDCSNNTPIAGDTNQSFKVTYVGSFAVMIFASPCFDTSTCININNIGIDERNLNNLIKVFPNPFSTQTTLQSDHFIKDGTLTIYNTLGEVVSHITNINGQSVSINRGN